MLVCRNAEGVHGKRKVANPLLYRMALAVNKNCMCRDIQPASHILYNCTVLDPPCSITNTTNKDLIECLRDSSF